MKAIPTLYKGIRFRSRLEATWAAFLDSFVGENGWEYEPAIFEGPGWTPDFQLSGARFLMEVKPVSRFEDWDEHAAIPYALARSPKTSLLFVGVCPDFLTLRTRVDATPARTYLAHRLPTEVDACRIGRVLHPQGDSWEHLDLYAYATIEENDEPRIALVFFPANDERFLFAEESGLRVGAEIIRHMWACAKNAVQWTRS